VDRQLFEDGIVVDNDEADWFRTPGGAGQERRCNLQAIAGVVPSRDDAERVVTTLRSNGVSATKIALLAPGEVGSKFQGNPVDGELSTGTTLAAVWLPGVGLVTGAGVLGIAILRAAGAAIGAVAGGSLEDGAEDLPEDEIFVYEDVLRKGRCVVIVLAEEGSAAESIRQSFREQGADAIDAARREWWMGLRGPESEHYAASGRNFTNDEKFYRLGFEAALHARTRCKEFDQVSAEMASKLEDLEQQYPEVQIEEAFTRGYQRGREHFQALCDQRAA
jgi:hypothetical protein